MSMKAGVDVPELLKRIETMLCPECKRKLEDISVPITQQMTVGDLLKNEASSDKKRTRQV